MDAVKVFAALSQDTRLAVLRLLITAGPNGLPAGEIADRLGVPPSTASFHLSALEGAGLTQSTRQSRQIIHAVRIVALRDLIAFLSDTCCGGQPELCGDIARLMPSIPEETVGMTPSFNVLFLCTRNSARSLMAKAILTTVGRGRFRAYSAGSRPAPEPMPDVIERLRALGHDVSDLHPKSWNEFCGPSAPRMDFVIALCDMTQGQSCPEFAGTAVTADWPLPDPAAFEGNPVERALLLNELYGSLRRRIEIFTSLPFEALNQIALKARLDEIGGSLVTALNRSR
jgi:ArsR family transcriptional regulator, arsenate/arsenite/antimonite-responsive transcriptional repressor / arsenate reductase (thioredoxin)